MTTVAAVASIFQVRPSDLHILAICTRTSIFFIGPSVVPCIHRIVAFHHHGDFIDKCFGRIHNFLDDYGSSRVYGSCLVRHGTSIIDVDGACGENIAAWIVGCPGSRGIPGCSSFCYSHRRCWKCYMHPRHIHCRVYHLHHIHHHVH